mgnify:CR=1 FL=1
MIRGQGGEGKTALAAELARWLVRSQQVQRAAFVSVELHTTLAAVLDAIGRQLVSNYSVAAYKDIEQAVLPVERALKEQSTLLVVDNLEGILLPPFVETPEALSEDARRELNAILLICQQLNAQGDTRLVFTSREALPAPFDGERNRRELHRLAREDAVKFVERLLDAESSDDADDATTGAAGEAIEQLVDAVHGHARTLALLAPSLRSQGVEATRTSLVALMAEMEQDFPASREQSVFASVELSLRRMSAVNRDRVRVLGVFHGGVQLAMLVAMTEWKVDEAASLANELVEKGLATRDRYDHLTLNPALCPYLWGKLDDESRNTLTARWNASMHEFMAFLVQEQNKDIELATTLTMLELPNLFALLEHTQRASNSGATIELATALFGLFRMLGRSRLLDRVTAVRDAASTMLSSTWNHASFQVQQTQIEQLLDGRQLAEALKGAQQLLERTRMVAPLEYRGADYDQAMASRLGLVSKRDFDVISQVL